MIGETTYIGGKNMINLKEISQETISKYNLEIIDFDIDENEFFIMIKNSLWWVLGIDEEKDLLYVQYDGDGVFHNIDTRGINDLEDNDYVLVGCCDEYVPGIISTRDIANPIDDAKDFINSGTVYRIKYIGD